MTMKSSTTKTAADAETIKCRSKEQLIKRFEEFALRFDQSHKDGRPLASSQGLSYLCKDLAALAKLL